MQILAVKHSSRTAYDLYEGVRNLTPVDSKQYYLGQNKISININTVMFINTWRICLPSKNIIYAGGTKPTTHATVGPTHNSIAGLCLLLDIYFYYLCLDIYFYYFIC